MLRNEVHIALQNNNEMQGENYVKIKVANWLVHVATAMANNDKELKAPPKPSPFKAPTFSSAFKLSDGWCVARAFLLILLGRGDPTGPYIIADHPRK